jgi:hypothetical protein
MTADEPEIVEPDEQDQAEVFDEATLDDNAEFVTLEEMPDVYDVTSALGDTRETPAIDAADLDPEGLDDEDLEDDEDVDADLDDDLEDEREDDGIDDEDVDGEDAVDRPERDEADVENVADVDQVTDADGEEADEYESEDLSDEDLEDLGYEKRPPTKPARPRPGDVPPDVAKHQDELLDEGVEETFPASDPVSVKKIT